RLLASLESPSKGLVGPWAHNFPHLGVPGPAIGFLQEAKRWWDRWLKDKRNGIDEEPRYRAWMQDAVRPAPQYAEIPGRWVAEDDWPSARINTATLHLAADGLRPDPGEPCLRTVASPQMCGIRAGEWCAFGSDGEMPRDQRPDDGLSRCFDTPPLHERVEILGAPRVRLELASDQPQANLCVRLCDVAPDGTSLRVSYALLNLSHRDGHAQPRPLEPGKPYTIDIALNDIAHAFPAGHRIRVALSSAYWPIAWPSPQAATLTVTAGKSTLLLPVRPPREADAELPEFEPPTMADTTAAKRLRSHAFRRRLLVDLAANTFHYELNGSDFDDASLVHFEDIDLKVGYTLDKTFDIAEDDPLSARQVMEQRAVLARGDWRVTVRLVLRLEADADAFHLTGELEADECGEAFVRRQWDERIPRRCL
ncbi:MAG: CocE/NonD family hydrolase, partial [Xanthomonadales bacterium]|nr:CocE/NonD family hydrolase [Xanthomonadales bacterium]